MNWSSPAYTNQDMPLAVYESLVAKGATRNIFFIPIIHSSSQGGACSLTAGSAYGTKYERLATLLGDQAEVVSICSSDYSAKLKSLTQGFREDVGRSDIEIPATIASSLKSVEVIRGTTVLNPAKDKDELKASLPPAIQYQLARVMTPWMKALEELQ